MLPRCCPGKSGEVEPDGREFDEGEDREIRVCGRAAGKPEAILWDGVIMGLGLRVRASGSASWMFSYRQGRRGRSEPARKVTLGSWPTLTIDAARAAAQAMAGEVALKQDPATDLRDERNRERRIVSAALDDYERALRAPEDRERKDGHEHVAPGSCAFCSARDRRADAEGPRRPIEALENAGKPGAATDLRSHSRAWLEWAVSRGLVQFNVLAGLRRARSSRAERLGEESKGKALSDEEIVALWNAPATMGAFGGMLRLGLLTGMRRNELAGLRWSDVRDDRIVLAAHATKTGAQHEIPLTAMMRNVLTAQPKNHERSRVPVIAHRRADGGLDGLVDAAVRASGVTFKLHDLRRTARTLMSRCGVRGRRRRTRDWACRRGLGRDLQQRQRLERPRVCVRARVCAHRAARVWRRAEPDEERTKPRVVALGARR